MPNPRIRLVVLFGGVSAEHDVSCVSASHVLRAADPERYDLVPVGITHTGEWMLSDSAAKMLADGPAALPAETLQVDGPAIEPLPTVLPATADEQVVVLPLIHGPMGEDGTVQGLLELAGVPYVGAGGARLRALHGQGDGPHRSRPRPACRRPAGSPHATSTWTTRSPLGWSTSSGCPCS